MMVVIDRIRPLDWATLTIVETGGLTKLDIARAESMADEGGVSMPYSAEPDEPPVYRADRRQSSSA